VHGGEERFSSSRKEMEPWTILETRGRPGVKEPLTAVTCASGRVKKGGAKSSGNLFLERKCSRKNRLPAVAAEGDRLGIYFGINLL